MNKDYQIAIKKYKKMVKENWVTDTILINILRDLGVDVAVKENSELWDGSPFWELYIDYKKFPLGHYRNMGDYYNPQNKTFTNSIALLKDHIEKRIEELGIKDNETDESVTELSIEEIMEIIRSMSEQEIIQTSEVITENRLYNSGAEFVLPSGKIISIIANGGTVHKDVLCLIINNIIDKKYPYGWYCEGKEDGRLYETAIDFFTDELGWLRVNWGDTEIEDRFYCVLPDCHNSKLTSKQYTQLEDFIQTQYDFTTSSSILVFGGSNGRQYKRYYFNDYFPEEIIKLIKRYYSSGTLYENLDLIEKKNSKKRNKKSHTKYLGVTSGDVAAGIKSFNAMMSPVGSFGEGYKKPNDFYSISDTEANWTPEGEDWHFWSSEADEYEPQYAQAYKCKLSPKDFLDLTTSQGANNIKLGDNLWGEFKELDDFKFTKQPQPIYLSLSFKDKNPQIAYVTGHEGRHRMFGLMLRGIKLVDVMLYCDEYNSEYDRHNPFVLKQLILVGQYNKAVKVKVNDLIPMSYAEHSKIRPNIKELKNYKEGLKFDFCEDFNHRTIKLPPEALKRSIELYFDERPYEIKKVSIKKLVDDNDLLNDDDLESYHQIQWENKPAKDFSINIDKLNNMRASEIPYASERNGKLILGDGRHRVRAAYNDGYEYIELPVIKESLTEAKADIDAFINKFGEDTYTNFLKAKDRLKNKGQSVDLTWYVKNMEKKDLDNLILSLYNKDTDQQKKRIIQGTDKEIRGKYNYLGEKNGYKVYQPLDVQASMDLGVNTGWCTTGRYGHYGHPEFTPSLEEAKKHWNDYTNGGIKFYYFLDPQTMYGEYALVLYPRILQIGKIVNDTYLQETNLEIYNAEDDLDYSVINKLPLDLIKEKVVVEKIDCKNGLFIDKDNALICANKDVNDVTIPDGVTAIGEKAFEDCSFLESVTIPDSVTSIGDCAFQNCSSLTSITFSNSVTYIGEYAFYNCFSLKSITIPNSVTSIRDCAFSWCSSLISITIPDSVTKIGYDVFYLCPKLTVHTNNEYVIEYCEEHDIDYRKITIDN